MLERRRDSDASTNGVKSGGEPIALIKAEDIIVFNPSVPELESLKIAVRVNQEKRSKNALGRGSAG